VETKNQFNLLVVDDEKDVQRSLVRLFARLPYTVTGADSGEDALQRLAEASYDLVLLDIKLPGMDGLTVLKTALDKWPGLNVIILTGHGGVGEAVRAIKIGAIDFFEKSIAPDLIRNKIKLIYEAWLLREENRELRAQSNQQFRFDQLIGESQCMLRLKEMVVRVAPTDTSVLIQGESGVGKELVAKALHLHSKRKSEVFMPVDCASLSDNIFESELFGHTKGAFTGAEHNALGLFRAADKGTVFLDEIGELAMKMQAKLLRVLQEREVRPVGSMTRKKVDVRIIAATNINLSRAVSEGTFRQDLYYRLSSITLTVPPLRARTDDIPDLCRNILLKNAEDAVPTKQISKEALQVLQSAPLYGNVRELENVLKSAATFCSGEIIMPVDLHIDAQSNSTSSWQSEQMVLDEEGSLRRALEIAGGSRRQAAKNLNISESTLYRRLREFGI
jgi:DNA-binding NtrC family response regulator